MARQACLLLLLACALNAQAEGERLSLEAAVQHALTRAPQLRAAAAKHDAAQALIDSAGRLPDPALILGVDNLPINGAEAYSLSRDFMTMRKIGVMQEFPRREKRRLQHQRAEAEVALASAESARSRLEVAREAAQAWVRRASAEQALAALGALRSNLEIGVSVARAGVAAGRTSTAEALAAESALARLKSRILQAQGEARQAEAVMVRWIGDDASRDLAPLPSFDQLPAPPAILLETVASHGAILPSDARIALARTDTALARADRRPDWSAELSFAKRGSEFSDMASLQFSVGLPLFAKHRQNPQIAARIAELRRSEAERDVEISAHTAELREALIAWEQWGEQLRQYEGELLPLARDRTRAAIAAYRSGRADLPSTLGAIEAEADLAIERAALTYERGRAWAYLRYLDPQQLEQ